MQRLGSLSWFLQARPPSRRCTPAGGAGGASTSEALEGPRVERSQGVSSLGHTVLDCGLARLWPLPSPRLLPDGHSTATTCSQDQSLPSPRELHGAPWLSRKPALSLQTTHTWLIPFECTQRSPRPPPPCHCHPPVDAERSMTNSTWGGNPAAPCTSEGKTKTPTGKDLRATGETPVQSPGGDGAQRAWKGPGDESSLQPSCVTLCTLPDRPAPPSSSVR